MELVDGDPRSPRCCAGPTSAHAARSAHLAAQVAAALGYAHRTRRRPPRRQAGQHPHHLRRPRQGHRLRHRSGRSPPRTTSPRTARSWAPRPTSRPSRPRAPRVDGRSDLYSLGIVLFEMLAGRPPFTGDSPVAVASKHVPRAAPPPGVFNADHPRRRLEAVTMKAIAKRPEDRYQHAGELRDDLLRYVNGEPVLAPDPEAAHRNEVDATTTMDAINRTQAVPIFSGPRTDLVRKRKRRALEPVADRADLPARRRPRRRRCLPRHPLEQVGLAHRPERGRSAPQLGEDPAAGRRPGAGHRDSGRLEPAQGPGALDQPGMGMAVSKGATVDLSPSRTAPGRSRWSCPRWWAKLVGDARSSLQSAGFQVQVQVSNVTPTARNPAPARSLPDPGGQRQGAKGSTVTLTVVGTPGQSRAQPRRPALPRPPPACSARPG